jgi:3-deoxy-D-manno-octulosonic-acid transferase
MPWLLNSVYFLALLALAPWLLYKAATTRKYRRGLLSKFLGRSPSLSPCHRGTAAPRPRAWFHGVSVGEIHLLRQVVARFRQRHPDWDCALSTTTDTGFDEARRRFPDLPVFYWPLDFSWAVRRALRNVRPNLIVLAECELWPNFLRAAKRRGVPVAVINGRMSPRSLRRYRRLGRLAHWLFRQVDLFAVQNADYAAHFRALGVPPQRLLSTGNVKYDGVTSDRANPRTQELRRLLGVRDGDLVWIAGSTQAPEEEIALDIFRRARAAHPNLRLFLVPRQRERFDEVAALLQRSGIPFRRRREIRDQPGHPVTLSPCHPVILVDTIGELGALWGLADVAFVGGSLDGRRGGQNMIEPAAYGAAVVFGPHVWNFRRDAENLVQADGAIQVADAAELDAVVRRLLRDAAERARRGEAARRFVLRQQGATERTLDGIDRLLTDCGGREAAA